MLVYHNLHRTERLFPNAVKVDSRKTAVKPHVHVPEEHFAALPAREEKLGHRFRFSQRPAVPASKKPATSLVQSVVGNSSTAVIPMGDTIELVDPPMVKSFQINSDAHESKSA